MKHLLTLLATVTAALATGRTSAPAGCITVGSGGSYSTIQSAVNSLSTTSSTAQCIFIKPGKYSEQVTVSSRAAQLTIYGYTSDISTYSSNQVTITGSLSQADGLNNDGTATLRVKAANFKMYNVNVANTYGQGSQAVALSAFADSGYYACAFTGYQDTLLAQMGYQLYAGCMIEGATDFVFGQNAAAWFEDCDIRVLSASVGYVTGKTPCSDTPIRCSWKANDYCQNQPMAAHPQTAHPTTYSTIATSRPRAVTLSPMARTTSEGRGEHTPASLSRRPP